MFQWEPLPEVALQFIDALDELAMANPKRDDDGGSVQHWTRNHRTEVVWQRRHEGRGGQGA